MPITLCQCNGLCEQRLIKIFHDLEAKSLLPEDRLKAAGKILQKGRVEPLSQTFTKPTGCCGGCLPHIEKIVVKGREQAALSALKPVGT